jgi:DNA-binding XRE family transcriptional regulator
MPDTTQLPQFARELRRHREVLGWGRTRLAREAGVGVSAITAIEVGRRRPSLQTAAALARALGWNAKLRDLVDGG